MLRIQARIPVVVMGETGCGKTSLVKFLSVAVGANYQRLDFHAGISDKNILTTTHQNFQLIMSKNN